MGCMLGEIFGEERFLPGADGRLIAFSFCADSDRLFIRTHTQSCLLGLLVCVRRQAAGLQLTQLHATGYSTPAGSGRGGQTHVSAKSGPPPPTILPQNYNLHCKQTSIIPYKLLCLPRLECTPTAYKKYIYIKQMRQSLQNILIL